MAAPALVVSRVIVNFSTRRNIALSYMTTAVPENLALLAVLKRIRFNT